MGLMFTNLTTDCKRKSYPFPITQARYTVNGLGLRFFESPHPNLNPRYALPEGNGVRI